jgi:putative RecB family exonuclease
MADPVVLSGSSLATFLRCGLQWELAYVRRIRRPPNIRQVLGIAAHAAVEKNMIQKIVTHADIETEDVLDEFSDEFDRSVSEVEDDDEDRGQAKDAGIAIVTKYHHAVAPKIQPVMVEEVVEFNLNGIPYSGYIDLVDDRRRVRDLKTTVRRPADDMYFLATTGYALGYRQKTGERESDIVLDVMIRRATGRADYLPLSSGGPVNDANINAFTTIVEHVNAAIAAGIFVPNGRTSPGVCNWCGYRPICPAWGN